jgi:CubicO group peptidase (beta-lactamase class C family)
MRRALLLALSLAVAAPDGRATAQDLDAATRARVDSVFARFDRTDSPGCALLVRRDGRTAYARGYGMASLELGVAITPATVMDIGSTSKQFTAAAIWLLAQQGKLSLDDEVQKHLPELPRFDAPVTIRQILQHTSGWRDYTDLLAMGGAQDEEVTTPADAMAALVRQRGGNFTPGTSWTYSNSGFFLASQVIERASGMPMRRYVREQIFAPLGMTQSDLFDDHARVFPGRATSYVPARGGWRVAFANWEQLGDGAVQTSVADLAKWDANFDAPVIGGRALVDSMQHSGRLRDGTPVSYAYGLDVDRYRGLRRVQHGGAWAGYRAMSMRFPDQRASIYLTCNAGNAATGPLAEGVADAVLSSALGPRDADRLRDSLRAPARADVEPLAGLWFDGTVGRVVRIAVDDSGAAMGGPQGGPMRRLRRLPDGGLVAMPVQSNTPRYRYDRASDVLELEPVTGPRVRFARVKPAVPLTATLRAELAGEYRSDEVLGAWTISVRGDSLWLTAPRRPPAPLTPVFADAFSAGGIPVRIVRDARGRVVALSVTTRGVRDLRWTRVR